MISRNFSRPRTVVKSIVWLLCVLVAAPAAIIPAWTENALAVSGPNPGMTKGYCASDPSGPVVYFSNIFDAVTQARNKISTQPLNNAFHNYLIEQYDYKTRSNFPATCRVFETLSQAEASKRQFVTEAQRANKQVVEVNWDPGPIVEVPQQGSDMVIVGPKGPSPTHTFCAVGNQSTMYFSAVFDTQGSLPNPKWNDAFSEFLSKQYGFRPEVDATCTIMGTVREAEFNLKARIGGVRYNRHKAVETGWKFDPSGTYKPAPKPEPKPDDDPEPQIAQRPKPAPSGDIRVFATKESPLVLAYCQKDAMLSKIFDCDRVQRSIYNYRMEHGSSEPLARLFSQEKVNLADAIGIGLNLWVRQRAAAQGFGNKASGCIEQKVAVSFRDKPYISRLQEIYNASVAACK